MCQFGARPAQPPHQPLRLQRQDEEAQVGSGQALETHLEAEPRPGRYQLDGPKLLRRMVRRVQDVLPLNPIEGHRLLRGARLVPVELPPPQPGGRAAEPRGVGRSGPSRVPQVERLRGRSGRARRRQHHRPPARDRGVRPGRAEADEAPPAAALPPFRVPPRQPEHPAGRADGLSPTAREQAGPRLASEQVAGGRLPHLPEQGHGAERDHGAAVVDPVPHRTALPVRHLRQLLASTPPAIANPDELGLAVVFGDLLLVRQVRRIDQPWTDRQRRPAARDEETLPALGRFLGHLGDHDRAVVPPARRRLVQHPPPPGQSLHAAPLTGCPTRVVPDPDVGGRLHEELLLGAPEEEAGPRRPDRTPRIALLLIEDGEARLRQRLQHGPKRPLERGAGNPDVAGLVAARPPARDVAQLKPVALGQVVRIVRRHRRHAGRRQELQLHEEPASPPTHDQVGVLRKRVAPAGVQGDEVVGVDEALPRCPRAIPHRRHPGPPTAPRAGSASTRRTPRPRTRGPGSPAPDGR